MENSTDTSAVRGIIFDYGGTIDNCGDHWAVIIREAYDASGIDYRDLDTFIAAYVFAERELARTRHILPHHTFADLMLIKARLELQELRRQGVDMTDAAIEERAAAIAAYCDAHARACVEKARPTLDYLAERYPMVLVSNFYGNIESVLAAYDLGRYFRKIIESAVVGVRKPDPAIFALGVEALGLPAGQVLVVGDSIGKDIVPAQSLGCKTAWIEGRPWFAEKPGEMTGKGIKSLEELKLLY